MYHRLGCFQAVEIVAHACSPQICVGFRSLGRCFARDRLNEAVPRVAPRSDLGSDL